MINLKTDPFRYKTLASLCVKVYINKYMPENSIVGNANSKQDSIVCREWLNHQNNLNIQREYKLKRFKNENNIDIHNGKVGEEPKQYYSLKYRIPVDGYDKTTNTVYQFYGCYWHGCRKCNPDNVIKYDKTMEQRNLILGNGYNMVECWECEWNETKKSLPNRNELETLARSQDINIRNALYGGRTEGFKRYFKCGKGVRAGHLDIVSLYPPLMHWMIILLVMEAIYLIALLRDSFKI
jgi:hypothetical protein